MRLAALEESAEAAPEVVGMGVGVGPGLNSLGSGRGLEGGGMLRRGTARR